MTALDFALVASIKGPHLRHLDDVDQRAVAGLLAARMEA